MANDRKRLAGRAAATPATYEKIESSFWCERREKQHLETELMQLLRRAKLEKNDDTGCFQ